MKKVTVAMLIVSAYERGTQDCKKPADGTHIEQAIDWQKQYAESVERTKDWQDRALEAMERVVALEASVERLLDRVKEVETRCDKLHNENARLRVQNATLRDERLTQQNRADQAEKRLAELQTELEGDRMGVRYWHKRADEAEALAAVLQAEIDDARVQSMQAVDRLEAENARLREQEASSRLMGMETEQDRDDRRLGRLVRAMPTGYALTNRDHRIPWLCGLSGGSQLHGHSPEDALTAAGVTDPRDVPADDAPKPRKQQKG